MNLHPLDIGIIFFYLISIFLVGFIRRKKGDSLDYMLMGRKLSLPAFVMTLVSTWYGGILGVSEYSTSYGISNWVIFGMPYYLFGIIFALSVAKRARALQVNSLAELIAKDYGAAAGRLSALWVLLLASPAPYVLTLGILLNFFTGISLNTAIIFGTLFSLLYIYRGGFVAVVNTDKIQFVLMFLGFAVILLVLGFTYKSPWVLWESLPASHRSLSGGHNLGYILVWFFIGSWTLVDPGFHQRVYATTTPRIAKTGILWAVLFWFFFDIMTTFTGLYAFSYLSGPAMPSQAFLMLGSQVLPIGLQGVFFAGLLATVMSTLDSNTLISGITLGKDILGSYSTYQRIDTERIIKVSMGFVLFIAIIMAIALPSVIDLWYTFGTIAIPALLAPTLFSISGKPLSLKAVRLNLIVPPLISITWFLFGKIDQWNYFLRLEPFYPGVLSSLLIIMLFNHSKSETENA
ncbi:MAG: sodium:solute symporter family protein [Candidatus Marinimicrobia bacterium]|nr:sodium:solute symporter family protein [Candidatus Neomarinimicrobiota bacterium]